MKKVVYKSFRNDAKEFGLEVQHNPYKFLRTQNEIMSAYALLPKFILGAGIGIVWSVYHIRRVNQVERFMRLSFSGDMIFQLWWRFMLSMVVGE